MSAVLASLAPRDPIADGRAALFGGDPVAAAQIFHGLAEANPTDPESRYWLYSALTAAATERRSQIHFTEGVCLLLLLAFVRWIKAIFIWLNCSSKMSN